MIQFRFVKFWMQLMSNFPIEVKNKLSCRRYWFTRVNLISSLVFVCFEFLELPKFKIKSISNIVRHLFILNLWVQKFYLDFRCHGSKNLNQTLDSFSFTNVNFFFFSLHIPFQFQLILPGIMDILSITIREWLSMHIDNGTRLVRFLNILYFILENILDSFSGRHWAFMCSTVHAAFSGHFEPVSISSYLSLPLQSIFSLLLSRPLVLTNWLIICPLQIVWFVSWFRFTNSRDFQHQNFWALCCFLQLIFLPFYFLSNLWETSHLSLKLFPMQRITNSHQLLAAALSHNWIHPIFHQKMFKTKMMLKLILNANMNWTFKSKTLMIVKRSTILLPDQVTMVSAGMNSNLPYDRRWLQICEFDVDGMRSFDCLCIIHCLQTFARTWFNSILVSSDFLKS